MFYDNFKRICAMRDTSPFAVTMKMGLSKSTASNWKNNGTIPKEDQLLELSKLLNCKVADFFADSQSVVLNLADNSGDNAHGNAIANIGNFADSADERELLAMYRSLSVVDRARLMVMVADFTEKRGAAE